ncbi:jg8594, partial [Pararge aegeria aegeria]
STPNKSKFVSSKINSALSNWARNSTSGTLPPKKRGRKSDVSLQSSASQWYTSTTNGNSPNSLSSLQQVNSLNSLHSAINSMVTGVNGNGSLGGVMDSPASPLRELRQEYGLTKGRSTTDAGKLIQHVYDAWELSQNAIGVFCDLSKAF